MRFLLLLTLAACGDSDVVAPSSHDAPVLTEPEPAPAPAPELAEGMEAITLFGGRTSSATRYASPEDGTIEKAIIASLTLLAAESYDEWMDTYCHEDACGDPDKRAAMTSHVLPAARAAASVCLHDGAILVTRQEDENGFTKTWIYCGESRMPAPSTAQNVEGAWQFSSISW